MLDLQVQIDKRGFRFYLCVDNLQFCADKKGCFLCYHREDFGDELDIFSLKWGWFPDDSLPWRWRWKEPQEAQENDDFALDEIPF